MTPYTLPCADGSLSLLQVMEFHAKANPDHPLFRYDSASAREGYEDITWRQAVNLFDTTAQIIRRRLGGGAAVDRTPPPVVGILASTSAIFYACLLFGTLRAGCPVFPLSTRNSDVAIAHLIAESGVKYLLVSQDAHMQNIAHKANGFLQSKNVHITLISIPTYEEICADEHEDRDALPPLQPIDDDHVLIIAHSSGSTSFPKIIPLTQKYFIKIHGPRPVDLSIRVQAAHGAAMFHAMGILSIMRAVFCGMIISLFPPTTNAVIATPERALASALSTKSTTMVCPPMFLEHLVHDPASVEKLRTFTHILFGGGPLARSVGDALDRSGVTLVVGYGITEAGPLSQPVLEAHGHGWEYFQFHASVELVLVPVNGDTTGSLFQLIVKQSATNSLVLPNTEVDGILAYDTKDIVQRHPTVPTLYRVYGRVDDQIMHSNGEKTNPVPIEQILTQDPRVKAAIMFGRERSHAGVIIAPSQDILDVESFRDAIWPTVEQANAIAPSHSRLFKDMIVLATASRPFQVTVKGTPRRQAILEDYAQEIDAAYVAFNHAAAPAGPQVHGKISVNDALEIVRGQVHSNVGPNISDNENLFDAGADSLLAARIRRGITQVLGGRIPEMVVQALPDDVVFTFPTITQLVSFVYGVSIGVSAVTDKPDTPYKNVLASIPDNKDNTIVRLCEPAAGEPPLILVHGGDGFIYSFVYFQKHFRTGLWAIQVVTETPCTSFVTQTDFYYRKIKEMQPTGPYRIGGYSAGAFMAYRIANLLEKHGDNVIQLALIDSSPLLTLAPRAVDPYTAETDFANPETLKAHHERTVQGLCTMMRGYKDPWLPKFADYTWERWNGRKWSEEVSELMAGMYENLILGSPKAFEFALSLAGENRVYTEVMRGMLVWMREVKAPVTLYKASRGVITGVAPEAQKEWWAFGLDWCCAELRVVEVDVDHVEIVNRDELVEDLQNVGT
ncbi:Acetyl-CoA synthetase-like protein [Mycena venus]|uniref:Acetyl-CoA synthetase-like protein n=1 Tax=Mycena venus TaxID=2733690 RepID=A0A8H7CIK7_9AGAR|nr:Acetyl-CoA synthetase-like protein [Mycena venus]